MSHFWHHFWQLRVNLQTHVEQNFNHRSNYYCPSFTQ